MSLWFVLIKNAYYAYHREKKTRAFNKYIQTFLLSATFIKILGNLNYLRIERKTDRKKDSPIKENSMIIDNCLSFILIPQKMKEKKERKTCTFNNI